MRIASEYKYLLRATNNTNKTDEKKIKFNPKPTLTAERRWVYDVYVKAQNCDSVKLAYKLTIYFCCEGSNSSHKRSRRYFLFWLSPFYNLNIDFLFLWNGRKTSSKLVDSEGSIFSFQRHGVWKVVKFAYIYNANFDPYTGCDWFEQLIFYQARRPFWGCAKRTHNEN